MNIPHFIFYRLIFLLKGRKWLIMGGIAGSIGQIGWAVEISKPQVALPTYTVSSSAASSIHNFDGKVQAVKQVVLAAQVAGHIVDLKVKAGDYVQKGQVLLRLDNRTAEQEVLAYRAQIQAAQAALEAAGQELQRKEQLVKQNYISQAALEQSQSQYKMAKAQVNTLTAQSNAAQTQNHLHILKAPFSGVVAQLQVEQGDLATPGRALLTLYAPDRLRVTAAVPFSVIQDDLRSARIVLNGQVIQPLHIQVLPTVDSSTLTREVRAELAPNSGAVVGQYAQLQLVKPSQASLAKVKVEKIRIPLRAVIYREELKVAYVLVADGKVQLRQLRLGAVQGDQVEVLAGLDVGERLVLEPQMLEQR